MSTVFRRKEISFLALIDDPRVMVMILKHLHNLRDPGWSYHSQIHLSYALLPDIA